jgi:hypothetical protein
MRATKEQVAGGLLLIEEEILITFPYPKATKDD